MGYIDPDNIYSIDVLKNNAISSLYGDKAKNGVIAITSKNIWKTEFIIDHPFESTKSQNLYSIYGTVRSLNGTGLA
ncbi:hypothetical protein [Snuella lapsa]|uniref:TonB-dependent receptor plug domain-containing protein n=1 Tax=Snuella lapsa TaxID=870481 RepID=A0ABP6Y6K9_9FLAO